MRQIFPAQGPELPLVVRARRGSMPPAVVELASYYGNGAAQPRGLLRANMVASADGAGEVNGRSAGLSGPADKMIFNVLRSLADLILVGAGTVRTERYRPVQADQIWSELRPPGAAVPPIAIVTGQLDLDPDSQLLTSPAAGAQTIVITTAAAPADKRAAIARHARIIEAGEDRLDVTAAIGALRNLGYSSILTEGGPTLLGHLVAVGLVDELCLTTSPLLAAGSAARIIGDVALADTTAKLSLRHVLTDDGFLFCRYARQG